MIYEQELYNQFTYKQDRPHFHSFPGDVSVMQDGGEREREGFMCM